MALESSKSRHMTKVTIDVIRDVSSCLESKFDKKNSNGKVSKIADNRFPCVMLLGGLSVNLNHLK